MHNALSVITKYGTQIDALTYSFALSELLLSSVVVNDISCSLSLLMRHCSVAYEVILLASCKCYAIIVYGVSKSNWNSCRWLRHAHCVCVIVNILSDVLLSFLEKASVMRSLN